MYRITHLELPTGGKSSPGLMCLKPLTGNTHSRVVVFYSTDQYREILMHFNVASRHAVYYSSFVEAATFEPTEEHWFVLPGMVSTYLERLLCLHPADVDLIPDQANDFCGSVLGGSQEDEEAAGLVCLWYRDKPLAHLIYCRAHYYSLFDQFPECFEESVLRQQRETMDTMNYPSQSHTPLYEFHPVIAASFCKAILAERTLGQIVQGAIKTKLSSRDPRLQRFRGR